MKITALRTEVIHIPFDPPIVAAIFAIASADLVLTFLETDAGIVGEGLVLVFNRRRLAVVHEMVRSLEPLVVGLDPAQGGTLNARAWRDLNFIAYEGVSILGLAAVDMAIWDLRAQGAERQCRGAAGCLPDLGANLRERRAVAVARHRRVAG